MLALVLILGPGIWAGVASAARPGTRTDQLIRLGASVGYAVPNFVLALLLLVLFTAWIYRWSGGLFYVDVAWHGQPIQWALPAIALAIPQAGLVARVVRASMLDTLTADYVRTARAKGLAERAVLLRHALRNSLIPLVTVMGPIAVTTLMGSIVVENVFNLRGLGPELVRGILARAYFTVTGVFTYYSLLAGLAMLAVDAAYVSIDPKIRY